MAKAFGDYLDDAIAKSVKTQAEFGRRVGLTRGQIGNVKSGRRKPSAADLHRWADVLHLDGLQRDEFIVLAILQHLPNELRPLAEAIFLRVGRLRAEILQLKGERHGREGT